MDFDAELRENREEISQVVKELDDLESQKDRGEAEEDRIFWLRERLIELHEFEDNLEARKEREGREGQGRK
jgi:hypothetical protein